MLYIINNHSIIDRMVILVSIHIHLKINLVEFTPIQINALLNVSKDNDDNMLFSCII